MCCIIIHLHFHFKLIPDAVISLRTCWALLFVFITHTTLIMGWLYLSKHADTSVKTRLADNLQKLKKSTCFYYWPQLFEFHVSLNHGVTQDQGSDEECSDETSSSEAGEEEDGEFTANEEDGEITPNITSIKTEWDLLLDFFLLIFCLSKFIFNCQEFVFLPLSSQLRMRRTR